MILQSPEPAPRTHDPRLFALHQIRKYTTRAGTTIVLRRDEGVLFYYDVSGPWGGTCGTCRSEAEASAAAEAVVRTREFVA